MSEPTTRPIPFETPNTSPEHDSLWARTTDALFESADGGATWTRRITAPGWVDEVLLHEDQIRRALIGSEFWSVPRPGAFDPSWERSEAPELDAYDFAMARRVAGEPRPRHPMAELLESSAGVLQSRHFAIGCGTLGQSETFEWIWSPEKATLSRTTLTVNIWNGLAPAQETVSSGLSLGRCSEMVRAVVDSVVRPESPDTSFTTSRRSLEMSWTARIGEPHRHAKFETQRGDRTVRLESRSNHRRSTNFPRSPDWHNRVHVVGELHRTWAVELGWNAA